MVRDGLPQVDRYPKPAVRTAWERLLAQDLIAPAYYGQVGRAKARPSQKGENKPPLSTPLSAGLATPRESQARRENTNMSAGLANLIRPAARQARARADSSVSARSEGR